MEDTSLDFSNATNPFGDAVNPFTDNGGAGQAKPTTTKDLLGTAREQLVKADEVPDYNMARGAVERGGQLMGGMFRAGDALSKGLEDALPMGGLVWEDGIIPKYYGADEYKAVMAESGAREPLDIAADHWKESDAGYQPNHTWEKVKDKFSDDPLSGSAWGEVAMYAAEQGVKSLPDMAAALLNLPAYITSRSGEMGEARAQNKGKDTTELTDVLEAMPFAVASAALERVGAKGITDAAKEQIGKEMLKAGFANATKRVAAAGGKAAGKEALTEFIQEGMIEYVGERIGTDAQMSLAESFDQGLAGAVAGGGYGGAGGMAAAAGRENTISLQREAVQRKADVAEADAMGEVLGEFANANDPFNTAPKALPGTVTEPEVPDFEIPQNDTMTVDPAGNVDTQGRVNAGAASKVAPKAPEDKTHYQWFEQANNAGERQTVLVDNHTGEILGHHGDRLRVDPETQAEEYQAKIKNMIDTTAAQREAAIPDHVPVRTEPFAPPVRRAKPTVDEIAVAAAETNTAPSEAQIDADNYKKGRTRINGFDIAFENPKGSTRSGVDEQGNKWESTMAHHYGDIKGHKGADGDDLDVFVGDKPESEKVFVIDQVNPETGKFDEHKVMMGFDSLAEAHAGYLANYEENWQGLGEISELHESDFKDWVKKGDTTKPYLLKPTGKKTAKATGKNEGVAPANTGVVGIKPTDTNEVKPTVSASGKAFASEKSAKASIRANIRNSKLKGQFEDYQVVPVTGGFGYQPLGKLEDELAGFAFAEGESVSAPNIQSERPLVEHATKKGKTLTGVVRSDLSKEQAQEIDPYTFKKDDGWFVREKYLKTDVLDGEQNVPLQSQDFVDDKRSESPSMEEVDAYLNEQNSKQESKPEVKPVPAQVSDYGTHNTLVSADRAAELREKLKKKLAQLNSGIDPEMMAIGTELAVFHIEAGARKFTGLAQAMARDLDTSVDKIRPYLRSWYNGARDMMEDNGLDVADMDGPDQVRSDLSRLEGNSTQAPEHKADLSVYLQGKIDTIGDNRKLKAVLAEYNGVQSAEVTDSMMKQGQEAMELALVYKAREIVELGGDDAQIYQQLVDLYQHQPNLNVRSSTSMENQAYSTPAPLSFVASRLAGINDKSRVYEPTAGNGMLLIGANPDLAIANELNDLRVKQLKDQGFVVTQNDATEFVPGTLVDAAIMNPPFGRLKDDDGRAAPVKVGGYTIKSIDHLIAAKALDAMSDKGRAVIIIGAAKKTGDIGPSDRTFFNWLYSHYNVADHFEVDGDLYKRQGAGWPVRVLVVNGRIKSNNISPVSGSIERVRTWEEVYDRYTESLDASQHRPDRSGAASADGIRQPNSENGPSDSEVEAGRKAGKPDTASRTERTGRTGNSVSGAGSRNSRSVKRNNEGDSRRVDRSGEPERADLPHGSEKSASKPAGPDRAANGTDAGRAGGRSKPRTRKRSVAGSSYQANYNTRSSGSNEAVLTPVNMSGATDRALADLESEVGNIDEYVMNALGYNSLDELHAAFMGLQVDTIAAGIHNMERGKGIIIADQTGVGKGRQAAGLLRYAMRQGKIPVFISVKDNLFTDMYNDLADIGTKDVRPLILNQNGVIKDGSQSLFKNPSRKSHLGRMLDMIQSGELPDDSNMLFLTYSQLNTDNNQRKVINALKDRAVFVMDESHNAAGERVKITKKGKQLTTAGFIYNAIEDRPVVYLSATYAKRADNMPVYYRTDLMDAVDNVNELVDAVSAGGSPLQTVMSGMLAESGQLFRRERSFDGIQVKTVIDTGNTKLHTQFADTVTKGLRAIVAADHAFHSVFVEQYASQIQSLGGDAFGAGNKAESSVDHTNFTSIVHNFISQLLLGLKAQSAAEQAIALHEKGVKPVIALENTMGAFLNSYVEETGAQVGDVVDADYRDVLMRALDRTRRISVKNANGDQSAIDIPLRKLDPYTASMYDDAIKAIETLKIDELPISPIDYVRNEMEQAGISVAEITGRGYRIDYSTGKPLLAKRSSAEVKDRRGTVDAFNTGSLDALVLNAAGSTGLSIHASEKFVDKKPRHMLVMQAMADINILMQMLGRINRTGQVELPGYSMMGLNIPAEKRPLARTANKMKSLNANTSANTDSDTSIDAPDIMNKYGDRVVNDYLRENVDVALAVDMRGVQFTGDTEVNAAPGTAVKFTGRLALLPVKQQVEIYGEIETTYSDLMEYLNKTNQNDLVPTVVDLDARILEGKIAYEGKAPNTLFGGHTILHKVDAKYQGKPPTAVDVKAALDKALKKGTPQEITDAIITAKTLDERYEKHLQVRIKNAQTEVDKVTAKTTTGDKVATAELALERATEAASEYAQNKSNMESMSRTFMVGNRVRLNLGDETVTGVVVGIKDSHKKGKGNPYAQSKTRVSFMVNSGARQIDLPFSQLGTARGIFLERLQSAGTEGLEDIFKDNLASGERREIRYVATGNLIAGSAKLPRGRIATFTDKKGDTHQGILMPRNYGDNKEYAAVGTSQNFSLRDSKALVKFLRKNVELLQTNGIASSDKLIRLLPAKSGGWEISLPKANKEASVRSVKFDQPLRDAMGTDFYGSGKTMSASFPDSKLPKVIPILNDLALMQGLPSYRDAWVAAGGTKAPEASASFSGEQATPAKKSTKATKPKIDEVTVFSTGQSGKGIDAAKVKQRIARKVLSWEKGPVVEVVNSVAELPQHIQSQIKARNVQSPHGARDGYDGTVYIVAGNLRNLPHADRILAHEAVGHYAMEKMLGDEFDGVLNKVQYLKETDPRIKKVAAQVNGEGDPDIESAEIIAKLAEQDIKHPVLIKAYAALRKFLKKLRFDIQFGLPELKAMLVDAAEYLRTGKRSDHGQSESEGSYESSAAAFSQDPDTEKSSLFSDTKEGAVLEEIQHYGNEAAEKITQLWKKNWTADLRPAWLGALTRRHMADIAGKALPQIKRYVRIAQEMDARRNELLTEGADLADRWTKFNLKNRKEAQALAELMHDATTSGVDPSVAHKVLITKDAVEKLRKKNAILIKERSHDGAGGGKTGIRSQTHLRKEVEAAEMKLAQERNRVKARPLLVKRWKALSPDAQSIYREVRDAYKQRQQMTLEAVEARIGRSIVDGQQAKNLVNSLREEYESVTVEDPYFPLARFGKYWVDARQGDSDRVFEMFETTAEQEAYIEKMRNKGYRIRHGAKLDDLKQLDGVSAKFVTEVETMLTEQLGDWPKVEAIKDDIYQMYLQSMPDLSVRKHFIHRKKVKGYAKDALRAYADSMFHGSYQLARLEHSDLLLAELDEMRDGLDADLDRVNEDLAVHKSADGMIGLPLKSLRSLHKEYSDKVEADVVDKAEEQRLNAIKLALKYRESPKKLESEIAQLERTKNAAKNIGKDRVKASHLYNEMLKRHEWAMNPKGAAWANNFSSIGFTWYLGVSPAAALVNVTQTPMVAYPMLAAKFGWKESAAALMNANNDYFSGGFGVEGKLTGDRLKAYREAVRTGVIDKTLAHDLAAVSEEGATYNPVRHTVMKGVSFLFHNAERYNREVTFMAAYDLARKKGDRHETAIDYAHEFTWDSHFDYSSGNKARFMQGDVAKVLLMFRQFSLNMTYLLVRNAQQSLKGESKEVRSLARRQLSGILGMHFIFAGAMGMPLWSVLAGVMNAVFDDEDEPWDFDTEFRNFMADTFGKQVGHAIAHGPVQAITGQGVSSRVSLNNLWLRESYKELEGRDQVQYWFEQLLGPIGGIALSQGTAYDLWKDGHNWRALEAAVPKFAKDGFKALRYQDEGVNNLRGDSLVAELSFDKLIAQGLGLTPAQISERYEANSAIKKTEQRLKHRRQNLMNHFALAYRTKDTEDLREIKRVIIRFNNKNPNIRIMPYQLVGSLRRRAKYSNDQIRGIVVDRKLRYLTENGRFAE